VSVAGHLEFGRLERAGGVVERLKRSNVSIGRGVKFLETAGGHEDAGFEGTGGFVVTVDGIVEVLAKFRHVVAERGQTVVEFAPEVADALGVFSELFLPPAVVHGAEERDQGRRGGEDDAMGGAKFDELGVVLERGTEEGFARKEENDELGGIGELLPIALGGERANMLAHGGGVLAKGRGAGGFVAAFKGAVVGGEGNFGVNHNGFAPGHFHQQIGAEPAGVGTLLFVEIAVALHAREFDDAAELDLAPTAPRDGGMEGVDEAAGLTAELVLGFDEGADLRNETFVGSGPISLHFVDLGIHAAEGFAHGPEQVVDRLLLLREIAGGALVELAELGAREIEKGLAALLQGLKAEGFEGCGELGLGAVEKREFLDGLLTFFEELGFEGGATHGRFGVGVA
jgi:hypothetical protein